MMVLKHLDAFFKTHSSVISYFHTFRNYSKNIKKKLTVNQILFEHRIIVQQQNLISLVVPW